MRNIAKIFILRVSLITLCTSLLTPGVSLLVSEASQGQAGAPFLRARQNRPQGIFPNLDDIENESSLEREPPAPIPSTIRAKRNQGKPWDGRRLGEPFTPGRLDQLAASGVRQSRRKSQLKARLIRRAHAGPRFDPPWTVPDSQFIQNFFSLALLRSATSEEDLYWSYQLRAAYAVGPTSVKLGAVELGRTLFESAAYAARNRNAHDYVYDLYKTYLMREPDAGGWAFWESLVPTHGREYVRRGFEESTEFATLMANIAPGGAGSATASSLITALVDPRNQPGNGMLTRDASWSVALLSLPGRSGLDLGLSLSYSSMVWTRSGPYFYFDEDNGFPSPGFRLGFPSVQRKVFDAQTAKNSYLLVTPAGHRVQLRQVSSTVYEAADSSYLQLSENVGDLLVRSTDGTQLTFVEANNEYRCTQIKDRNGNYITVNYNALGHITTVSDTLGRVITFNYDTNANLLSITQAWNGQPSHQWVSFGWGTRNMQHSFANDSVIGTKNGAAIPVITQVGLNDTSHFTFNYTNSLQVSEIKNYFGTLERNATTFIYQTATGDVPRLSSSSVSAHNWSGYNNVPAQVTTQYSLAGDGACVITAPNGTIYKEYYGTGWQKGLTTLSEVWSGGVKQKWTTTTWTQDNTSVSYQLNPRVTETNVYDAGGNRRRTTVHYDNSQYAQYGLPTEVREYAADAGTVIRKTITDYNLSQAYLDRRIIGLVAQVQLSNGTQSLSKTTFAYDDPARLAALPAAATQHDTSYSTSSTARGNLTSVARWDVNDINNAAKKLTSFTNYYTSGSPASATDPAGHQQSLSYADSFSDNLNRNTFAYPTTLTDADNFSSSVKYNFDFGATTRTESPAPAGQSQGTIRTMTYNGLGQLERVTTTNNGAYKRFWYGAEFTASYATVNNVTDEAYSIAVRDGLGRVIGSVRNHPGSTGGYSLVNTVYDQMGRAWLQSNPTEVNNSWVTTGDDAAGIYYTQQTYDWQGRPLVTTNPDGTTRMASYAGCGCAGGQVVTLTDEGTIDAGVTKRRQQKIYSDVLGRTTKTELLNWQGGSVYSATVNTYNALDQVTQVRQYAGPEGSATYQDTTITYDGYGRLKTKHMPEQSTNTSTSWEYNSDSTIQKVTDGRGAATNYNYNNRHLLTGMTYNVPAQSPIPVPSPVSLGYDAAGNRSTMSDGTGSTSYSYDSLSRLISESRTFSDISGTYVLNYEYNFADAVKVLTIPFKSQQVGYNYDTAGRLSGVTASGFSASYGVWPNLQTQSVTSFASNITYRAWGARKSMTYGNTTGEQTTYNSRLQPTTYTLSNMNYQNTNVCCSYPTYSTMTWTYGYYDDGSIKHAWDSTNEWFDRAYNYDHAGRLKEASTFRRARGLSPYPAVSYPDPYHQTISYDAFNHSSRTGSLYTGQPAGDIGAYVNNRRTDSVWEYDADGNTTRDPSYQQTFNAAGLVTHSVSHAKVGDGIQYPLEPRLDITQTYDGLGVPAKREQISRLPGLIDESGNQGEPIEDLQTNHYIRSSVFGGAAIAELGSSNVVYIYADGQRIARDVWGNVTFEHHNPVTGNWVTSHGHPGSRMTGREERDPRGAELPLSNPFPASPSYVDMKFAQPLFFDGGDPYDYSSGRSIDGLPVSEGEFQRRVANGSVITESMIFGPPAQTQGPTLRPSGSPPPAPTFTWQRNPLLEVISGSAYIAQFPKLRFFRNNEGTGKRSYSDLKEISFNHRPQNPVPQVIPLGDLKALIQERLKFGECADYVKRLISKVAELNPSNPASSTDILGLYDQIDSQPNGGFVGIRHLAIVDPSTGLRYPVSGSTKGSLSRGNALVQISLVESYGTPNLYSLRHAAITYGITGLHEIIHQSGSKGFYTDYQLALAAKALNQNVAWSPLADNSINSIIKNSGYWDSELKKDCVPESNR